MEIFGRRDLGAKFISNSKFLNLNPFPWSNPSENTLPRSTVKSPYDLKGPPSRRLKSISKSPLKRSLEIPP